MSAAAAFWDLAAPYLADGRCDEGTIMGHACLRRQGEFVAMHWKTHSAMVVKLPAPRVRALIADGAGEPFAPAGRAFREWLAVPERAASAWESLLIEAVEFAGQRGRLARR